MTMRYFYVQIGIILCTLLSAQTHANTLNESLKLIASDVEEVYWYGSSVAISGDTISIGSAHINDMGSYHTYTGSAYIYDATTGNERFKLSIPETFAFAVAGYQVAISDGTALIGSRWDSGGAGATNVFDTNTGQERFKLTAPDISEREEFGGSVAISGNTAVIGALYIDYAGTGSEAAYVFDTNSGNELFKLSASDAAEYDAFGHAVAVSGNKALVGAFGDDVPGKSSSGAVYVYNTETGNELYKLTASDATGGDLFGWSVAASGNIAVIGAYGDSPWPHGYQSGSAYVFDISTGEELFKLIPSDAAAETWFGYSVGISGNFAVVSAIRSDGGGPDTGSAYIFDITTGEELFKLTASDAEPGDFFGRTVAISGNTAVVGAPGANDGGDYTGAAYVFNFVPEPASVTYLAVSCLASLRRGRAGHR